LNLGLRRKDERTNRQVGRHKGSSKLTEAQKIDVRFEIAKAAGVSVGNVSAVKQLLRSAHPELLQALRSGEVRIHRAVRWAKEAGVGQREALEKYRSERGLNRTIRALISRHKPTRNPSSPNLHRLGAALSALPADKLASIKVSVGKTSERLIIISQQLLQELELQGEQSLHEN